MVDRYFVFIDVAAEKTQKALIDDVEGFDTGKLKHAQTQEKNPLPDKFGRLYYISIKSTYYLLKLFILSSKLTFSLPICGQSQICVVSFLSLSYPKEL